MYVGVLEGASEGELVGANVCVDVGVGVCVFVGVLDGRGVAEGAVVSVNVEALKVLFGVIAIVAVAGGLTQPSNLDRKF